MSIQTDNCQPAKTQAELAKELMDNKPTSFPPIQPGYHYRPKADELRAIAAEQTLAVWRCKGKGPPYTLCGSNVTYEGSDLLAWLKSKRIDPEMETA
jgi:hypothetical protein